MGRQPSPDVASLVYKHLDDGTPMHFSVYPPTAAKDRRSAVPAIVYFHGGGLVVGNRYSWHPEWLQRRANALGFAFLAPDYRLMPPSNGHAILEDIQDFFSFLAKEDIYTLAMRSLHSASLAEACKFEIDKEAIVVAGSSGGGLCVYLAAAHCNFPKPKAILSIYGMGGDFFTPHYLAPKHQVFFRGRELLDPTDFPEYVHPSCSDLKEIADSPLAYHPPDYHIPGYPSNRRMFLARLYLQFGVYLDYYTGSHSPSLSDALRPLVSGESDGTDKADALAAIVPEEHRRIIPQLQITSSWPPTIFFHGTADSAVPITESRSLARSLIEANVNVKLFEFDGEEHSFDYEATAEDKYGKSFDEILGILQEWVTR